MRKLWCVLCCCMILLGICGFTEREDRKQIVWNGTVLKESKYQEKEFDTSGDITFDTEHEVYGKDIPYVVWYLENHSGFTASFDDIYELEVLIDGTWYLLDFPRDTSDVRFVLYDGRKGSMRIWLDKEYILTDGIYRIVKEVTVDKVGEKIAPPEKRLYQAIFQIGESPYTATTPFGYQPLEKLPRNYTLAMAKENGDVIVTEDEIIGEEKILAFLQNSSNRYVASMLRMTTFDKNGRATILDVTAKDAMYFYEVDRERTGGKREEKIYSYLITDGKDIYLSNWGAWKYRQGFDRDTLLLRGNAAWVQEMLKDEEGRLKNTRMYRLHSPDGFSDIELYSDRPLEFGVGNRYSGSVKSIRDVSGVATAIEKVEWLTDNTVLITCKTKKAPTKYFVTYEYGDRWEKVEEK